MITARAMQFYMLDPLVDNRWCDLVASHPRASVFHHQGWIKALSRTYGFRPMVLTSTPAGESLSNGIAFCEVRSWITGSRLVSLPFADHTEPLLNEIGDLFEFMEWMRTEYRSHNWKYIELRPLSWDSRQDIPLRTSESFWFHSLDLSPSLEQIFRGMHKSCLQRRIRRAEREHLSYERGHSESLMNDFYRLLLITRRRHGLLPQPRAWFRNLITCMGARVEFRLARKDGIPIAAILTLKHRRTVVYKYGCSDGKFHHLAGMPFLFWKLIEEARNEGGDEIDFGRTDTGNRGLIEFKDRFGSTRRRLTYVRLPEASKETSLVASCLPGARRLFALLPDAFSSLAGQMAYRHIA